MKETNTKGTKELSQYETKRMRILNTATTKIYRNQEIRNEK
jgi:hypothetical protein